MTCSRCLLPFTADYPEYNPGAGYHEASACIRGLRAALVEAQKPAAEAHATIEKLQVTVNDMRAALAEQKPGIAAFGKSMWQNGFDHGKGEGSGRIAELLVELAVLDGRIAEQEAELATLREQTTPRRFEDSLPEDKDTFLVWFSHAKCWNQWRWERLYTSGDFIKQGVSHWLPMPPAPEVAK